MSSELDPTHVEAVADLVAHVRDQYPRLPTDADSGEIAETLLTSTDPAVHAALLAALVRAGVLSEEVRVHYEIVAEVDGQRASQHRSDDPRYLREQLTKHPRRYRPGSRVVRGTVRWLMTDGGTRWEDVDA